MRLLKSLSIILLLTLALPACVSTSAARPTSTPLTLPSPTPIVIAQARATATPSPSPTRTPSPSPNSTDAPSATPTGAPRIRATATPAALAHDAAPAAIQNALSAAGIDANVYWFKSGDEDQLMVQYTSPLRFRPGYEERLQTVKEVVAARFLLIAQPFYALYIAATDITGTSDTVLRLDRTTVERWARGEIGDADFYNNGFVPSGIVITCDGECSGVRPTPFPTFPPFPFPFPTPTP
ncbi:MAG TPA: hypothetical protein VIK33_11030 [Anaerolineae bacterium]